MVFKLSYIKTGSQLYQPHVILHLGYLKEKKQKTHDNTKRTLTSRHDDPGKVEADVVDPKVQKLGPAVRAAGEVRLDQARRVVQRYAVEVRHAHDDLERVAEVRGRGDARGAEEGDGAP